MLRMSLNIYTQNTNILCPLKSKVLIIKLALQRERPSIRIYEGDKVNIWKTYVVVETWYTGIWMIIDIYSVLALISHLLWAKTFLHEKCFSLTNTVYNRVKQKKITCKLATCKRFQNNNFSKFTTCILIKMSSTFPLI